MNGSNDGKAVLQSEVFSLSNETGNLLPCPSVGNDISVPHGPLEQFPKLSFGGLLKETEAGDTYVPIACGHNQAGGSKTLCFHLLANSFSGFTQLGSMIRIDAASVVINNGTTLWATGGWDPELYQFLERTDLLTLNSSGDGGFSVTSAPPFWNLPIGLAGHCIEVLDGNNRVVLVGGQVMSDVITNAWTIDLDNKTDNDGVWNGLGALRAGRCYHMCGVLEVHSTKILVVAGGLVLSPTETPLNSVELLEIRHQDWVDTVWIDGPSLPVALYEAASATTLDRSRLFIVGGQSHLTSSGQSVKHLSKFVFHLQCQEDVSSGGSYSCEWAKNDVEQQRGVSEQFATVLPPFSSLDTSSNYVCNLVHLIGSRA